MKAIPIILLAVAIALVWRSFAEDGSILDKSTLHSSSVDQASDDGIASTKEFGGAGRISIPSATEDEVLPVEAKPWYEDEEQIALFLEAYEGYLSKALVGTDELRSKHNPARQAELLEELDGKSGKTIFGMYFPGDYEGLTYDSLNFALSCIRVQNMAYAQWEASGKKIKELPDIWSLSHSPEEYPPSFMIYKIKGTADLNFSKEQIEYVSRLKNQLIYELNAVQGREFETRPAAAWAAMDRGTPLVDFISVPVPEIIPEWKYLAEARLAAKTRYVMAIEMFASTLP
jgi:hypothetical protein